MSEKEKELYQSLSKTQKDFVDALKNIGFSYLYRSMYEMTGWGKINVLKHEKLESLLKCVHEQGKDQKRFEFQKVLGI